ncbi:MAG: TolB family protein [Alkalispirochaeta sp.]
MRAYVRRRAAPILPALGLVIAAAVYLTVPTAAYGEQWLRYDTDHFTIIYREDDASDAARVAELAPSVWERTTEFLQYEPSEQIPVVLYGQTARANGFFTPFPPHVALFTAAPAGPWMGARTEDWLESVFVHEVTHYLHLMQPIGFFGTASRVFGPLAAAGGTLFLPGWALEGPTTTAETILTTGGRGRNPYFEMEWVAPILADRMYSYDQAGVASAYPPRGRIYSAGYLLTDHLLREYGDDAFIELNREFQRLPFLGMRRALRRTTGRSGPEIHQEMVESRAARYASRLSLPAGAARPEHGHNPAIGSGAPPALPVDERDPLRQRHLLGLTDRGAVAFHRGAFDPGSVQLLQEDGSWRYLAAVTPLDEYSVAIAADGTVGAAVVHRADRAGVDAGANVSYGDLFHFDLDGGGQRRVTTGARLFHPTLDGDGDTLIAIERTGRFSRVVDIDAHTGERTPIYEPSDVFLSMPALSRDGRYLAVVENVAGTQSIVVLARRHSPDSGAAGGGTRQTAPSDDAASPHYSPVYRIDVGSAGDAEYQPQFVGDRELWFVGDAEGLLQLYRTRLPKQLPLGQQQTSDARGRSAGVPEVPPPIDRLLADQVGVVSGFPDGPDTLLYGTYREYGYTVRRGIPTPRPVGAVTIASAGDVPGGSETDIPRGDIREPASPDEAAPIVAASTRYWDLPRPVLWVPTVAIAGEVAGSTRFDVGAGLIATSNLARHNLQAFAAYNPTDGVPSGSVEYTYSPGPTSFSVAATTDYTITSPGSANTVRDVSVSLTRPLWYDENATRYQGVAARIGGAYSAEDAPDPRQFTSFSGAARVFRYRYSGSSRIVGGTGGEVQAAARYLPPLLDQPEPDLAGVTSAAMRLGRRTGRLRLTPLAAVAVSGSGAAVNNLPWRATVFAPEGAGAIEAADTALLGRVALTGALRPLDIAARGISLQDVGGVLYTAHAAAVNAGASGSTGLQDATLTADNHAVAGLEVTVHGQFNLIPLQITAGVALRLPYSSDAGERRTQFYVNLGGAAVEQVSTIEAGHGRTRPVQDATAGGHHRRLTPARAITR